MRIVFASNNAGKIREVAKILNECFEDETVELLSLKDIDFFEDIIEDGENLRKMPLLRQEQSLVSATFVSRMTQGLK